MELPKRKQTRLPEYDYSSPGAYFITVCTQNRKCILSDISVGADALGGPQLRLTAIGKIVEKHLLNTDRIQGVHLDKYVIMPNHVHMILKIDDDNGPSGASDPAHALIPHAVGAWKRLVDRELGQSLFQRSCHEHVIRGETDYREIWEYIEDNPARWIEDRYYIQCEHTADGRVTE